MIQEIEPAELASARDRDNWAIVDVREDWERDVAQLEGSINIPLGDLMARINEVPRDQNVAVLCHSGMRSAQATQFLNNSGLEAVYNIVGGIDRWSTDVDPSIARY
ncbi:MAG: rhodanese-like domain-containing protein [Pseudomonadota bacterium]